MLEPVRFSEPLNPALQMLQPLGCKGKVFADLLRELRAKAAPVSFGLLSELDDIDRLFFSFILQQEIIRLLLA